VRRLSGRRSCPDCGAVFHVEFDPPSEQGVCDACGHELIQRRDDKPEVIEERFEEYQAKTEPLVEFYREQGTLEDIDGEGAPDVVFQRVLEVVDG
jgi:adenylate kinase